MNKTILVIEDELNVAAFIRRGLNEADYNVLLAYNGMDGIELLTQNQIDLVVLDVIMPEMDGFAVSKTIREMGFSELPIIMLTALSATNKVVEGLDSGADDYLTKPFKFQELLARIRALLRRNSAAPSPTKHRVLRVHDLELDLDAKVAKRNNDEILLTSTEFRLLEFLLQNKNRVLSRIDILENVWDITFNLGTNVVDVYINYLRNKIDKPYETKLIQTVIGMGYALKE